MSDTDKEYSFKELCERVLAYAKGEGEYNFSTLPEYERANEAYDAWIRIELDIQDALHREEHSD